MSSETIQGAPAWQPLGKHLLERALVTVEELERALELQRKLGGRLGSILVRAGVLSESALLQVLSEQLAIPLLGQQVSLPSQQSIAAYLECTPINHDWLIQEQMVLWEDGGCLFYAARDLLTPALREVLEHFHGDAVLQPVLCRTQELDNLLEHCQDLVRQDASGFAPGVEDARQLREMAEEAPIVELVNNIIGQAIDRRSSDIHIEPREFDFRVRFRVDGVLHEQLTLPLERFAAVVSRIKLISGVDIAERRLPQDGRMSIRVSGAELDVRVSSLPGVHGESVVMRLLPRERESLRLEHLGMLPDHLATMRRWAVEPHGIVLVTGPTGSGKSTTLYGALEEINDGVRKIITVEDPVEYQLPNITQVQVHADIGLTFASALRSILRQDPDVIMIGEIRDLETAEIAVQSSLTGHLVFATLHTNDAVSAFTRLIDMGVEPFLVASPIRGIQAQRLVRRICPHCAERCEPILDPAELAAIEAMAHQLFPEDSARWLRARGCERCEGTGYRGRVGIYELVEVSTGIRDLIVRQATLEQLRSLALQQGMRNLRVDGLLKAWLGQTSVAEVHRVTSG